MNSYLHNAIADMPGPQFIVLYAIVCAATLAIEWFLIARSVPDSRSGIRIPDRFDPYEIAFLRDGAPEVARVAVAELARRGLIAIDTDALLGRVMLKSVEGARGGAELTAIESAAYHTFRSHKSTRYLATKEIGMIVMAECPAFESRLQDQGMLYGAADRHWRQCVGGSAFAVIFFLGLYKLSVALMKGHYRVEFLGAVLGLSIIFALLTAKERRITPRGRKYLAHLQTAFSRMKNSVNEDAAMPIEDMVGLYGLIALIGSQYAYMIPPDYETTNGRQRGFASLRSGGGSCSTFGSSGGCSGGGGGGGGCGGCGSS